MGTGLVKFSRETVRDVKQVARGWRWGRRAQVPRSAEPYVIPKETSVFPTKWARKPAAIAIREVLQKGALNSVLRFEVNPQVSGLDSLRKVHGPAVIVANHSSHLDTPLVLCTLPDAMRRKTAVAAAADYFFDTWWRATASAIVFNTFPIERRGGKLSSTPGDLLADGWNVVVFPEGTRGRQYALRPFKKGPFVLAIAAQAPVVPVLIYGAREVMPKGTFRVHSATVHVHFLEAVETTGLDYDRRHQLMRTVWDRIAACLRDEHGIGTSGPPIAEAGEQIA
jgi:1-acyl-sn-glycerol-3-phosphate acyltransferase